MNKWESSKRKKERTFFDLFVEKSKLDLTLLKHQDAPDFVISYNGRTIGFEVTDGGSEEFNRALGNKFASKPTGMSTHNLSDRSKEARRSTKEIEEDVKEWQFVSSESDCIRWASRMRERIEGKVGLLERGEIESFPENWLLIFNTQDEWVGLEVEERRLILAGALGELAIAPSVFDKIYLLSISTFVVIDNSGIKAWNAREI